MCWLHEKLIPTLILLNRDNLYEILVPKEEGLRDSSELNKACNKLNESEQILTLA